LVLPWALVLASIAGCVAREIQWRAKDGKALRLQEKLEAVWRSSDAFTERAALQDLANWLGANDVAVSIVASDRETGGTIPMSRVTTQPAGDVVFEVGFDCDANHIFERTYQLSLKSPANIGFLMME
jgi:hypothetical protein